MHKTEDEWIEELTRLGGYWKHDGNPKRPHALLTSGNHSDGFFNATKVIERPRLLAMACSDLLNKLLVHENMFPEKVIGSAFGAITIAHEFGRQLDILSGFTEPVEDEKGKKMVLKRFSVLPKTPVLVVEDVLTTGKTTRHTISELEARGAMVFEDIFVLVNRSGRYHLDGRRVISLVSCHMPIWTPKECPLCKEGSEAVRPKDNWDKLTANY